MPHQVQTSLLLDEETINDAEVDAWCTDLGLLAVINVGGLRLMSHDPAGFAAGLRRLADRVMVARRDLPPAVGGAGETLTHGDAA